MTRSHHLATIHIATTDLNEETMVLPLKRVPPKSFVRSRARKAEASLSSRPARTPPSTFLFLHLYLSNSPRPEGLSPLEGFRSPFRRQITTDRLSAVRFTHQNEELREAQTRSWPKAKTAPRSVGRSINPPDRPCQRLMSTNRRIMRTYFATPRTRCFCGLYAVLEPQSCDVLAFS